MKHDTWHVCSLVVQVELKKVNNVQRALFALPETEIPASNEAEGKLIVIVQSSDSEQLYQRIESIKDMTGVLAVSLVYHQQDQLDEEKP